MVLLLQVYIYAGAGAAPRLTPKHILKVIANMRPALRAGDFDAALQRGAVDIGMVLRSGRAGKEDGGSAWRELLKGSFWFMLLGGIVGLSWWCACQTYIYWLTPTRVWLCTMHGKAVM